MKHDRAPDRKIDDGGRTPGRGDREAERWAVLHRLEDWFEWPMVVLGFIWLVLLVLELVQGLSPFLAAAVTAIWILFILDFLMRFALAPRKFTYLKGNWLTAIALAVPALRVLRFARALRVLRAARGIRLVKVVSSLNRGMRSLGRSMERRGFGYVAALAVLITLAGAAGMYAFENVPGEDGFDSYGEALWWTAMVMTTLGSQYWPQTAEGRILGFLLSLFAIAVFGYITATLATYFIGEETKHQERPAQESLWVLRAEVAALREELRALRGADRRR